MPVPRETTSPSRPQSQDPLNDAISSILNKPGSADIAEANAAAGAEYIRAKREKQNELVARKASVHPASQTSTSGTTITTTTTTTAIDGMDYVPHPNYQQMLSREAQEAARAEKKRVANHASAVASRCKHGEMVRVLQSAVFRREAESRIVVDALVQQNNRILDLENALAHTQALCRDLQSLHAQQHRNYTPRHSSLSSSSSSPSPLTSSASILTSAPHSPQQQSRPVTPHHQEQNHQTASDSGKDSIQEQCFGQFYNQPQFPVTYMQDPFQQIYGTESSHPVNAPPHQNAYRSCPNLSDSPAVSFSKNHSLLQLQDDLLQHTRLACRNELQRYPQFNSSDPPQVLSIHHSEPVSDRDQDLPADFMQVENQPSAVGNLYHYNQMCEESLERSKETPSVTLSSGNRVDPQAIVPTGVASSAVTNASNQLLQHHQSSPDDFLSSPNTAASILGFVESNDLDGPLSVMPAKSQSVHLDEQVMQDTQGEGKVTDHHRIPTNMFSDHADRFFEESPNSRNQIVKDPNPPAFVHGHFSTNLTAKSEYEAMLGKHNSADVNTCA